MIGTVALSGLAGLISFAVEEQQCVIHPSLVLNARVWFIFSKLSATKRPMREFLWEIGFYRKRQVSETEAGFFSCSL